jgi:hypothetical protein
MESTLAQNAEWSAERRFKANCEVTTMVRLWPEIACRRRRKADVLV